MPTISLADLLAQTGDVDLLKCDIEGGEFAAFHAAPPETPEEKIRRLVMEVHVNAEHPLLFDGCAGCHRGVGSELLRQSGQPGRARKTWFLMGENLRHRVTLFLIYRFAFAATETAKLHSILTMVLSTTPGAAHAQAEADYIEIDLPASLRAWLDFIRAGDNRSFSCKSPLISGLAIDPYRRHE